MPAKAKNILEKKKTAVTEVLLYYMFAFTGNFFLS